MIQPIKPQDVEAIPMPDVVIIIFNDLIQRNWDGTKAVVMQSEAVKLIAEEIGVEKSDVFKNRWLDVEGLYKEAGWNVRYDAPWYNESYEPTFTFRKPPTA